MNQKEIYTCKRFIKFRIFRTLTATIKIIRILEYLIIIENL